MSRRRADVDDAAAAGLQHRKKGRLAAVKDATQIDVDGPLPLSIGQVPGVAVRGVDGRVVHQNIQAAVLSQRQVHQRLTIAGLAGVHDHAHSFAASGQDLLHGTRGLLNISDDDPGAGFRQNQRDALADALGGAGDDSDLSIQPVLIRHFYLPSLCCI